MEIAEGEHTAIVGPNGSGKSTLIKLITRQHYALAHPDNRPSITIFGQDRWNVFDLRALLGIVSADMSTWRSPPTASLIGYNAVISGFFASQGARKSSRSDLRTCTPRRTPRWPWCDGANI